MTRDTHVFDTSLSMLMLIDKSLSCMSSSYTSWARWSMQVDLTYPYACYCDDFPCKPYKPCKSWKPSVLFPIMLLWGSQYVCSSSPWDQIMEGLRKSPFESPQSSGRGLILQWTEHSVWHCYSSHSAVYNYMALSQWPKCSIKVYSTVVVAIVYHKRYKSVQHCHSAHIAVK